MSLFDMFRSGEQAPAAQPAPVAPVQPGNLQPPTVETQASPGTAPNGIVPVPPVVPETVDDSPLAEFTNLWEAVPKNDDEPAAPAPITTETVGKAVAGHDFTKAVTAETLAKIAEGGEGAVVATLEAMNTVAQQAFTQATVASTKLAEKAVAEAVARAQTTMPELLRDQAAANHAKDSNPIFTHPAAEPFIETARLQLLTKYPNATPVEITEMTTNFITAIADSFAPEPEAPEVANGETDWSKFLPENTSVF